MGDERIRESDVEQAQAGNIRRHRHDDVSLAADHTMKMVMATRLPVTSISFYKDGRIKRVTIDGGGWVPALQVQEILAIEEAIQLLREHPIGVVYQRKE